MTNLTAQGAPELPPLPAYDAGLLSDFGGGSVDWWQDYIRAELGRAHDFYESHFADRQARQAAPEVKVEPVAWWRVSYVDENGHSDADVQITTKRPDYLSDNGYPWEPLYATPSPQAAEPVGKVELLAGMVMLELAKGVEVANGQSLYAIAPAAPAEPDMRAVCDALGFDPTNHHNAAKYPYCRPDRAGVASLVASEEKSTFNLELHRDKGFIAYHSERGEWDHSDFYVEDDESFLTPLVEGWLWTPVERVFFAEPDTASAGEAQS